MAQEKAQQPSLGLYLRIWGLLFVLSTASYLVDVFNFQGLLRWSLLIVLMLLQAGLIVSVLMHMIWERLALVYAVVVPPVLLVVLLGIGAFDGSYTHSTRGEFFAPPAPQAAEHH